MVEGEVCHSDVDSFSNIHCKHGQAAVLSGNIGGLHCFELKMRVTDYGNNNYLVFRNPPC